MQWHDGEENCSTDDSVYELLRGILWFRRVTVGPQEEEDVGSGSAITTRPSCHEPCAISATTGNYTYKMNVSITLPVRHAFNAAEESDKSPAAPIAKGHQPSSQPNSTGQTRNNIVSRALVNHRE